MSDLVLIRRRRYCKNRINSQLRQSNRCCSLLMHLTVLALQHDRYRSHCLFSNWTLWHHKHSILIHEMIVFPNAAGTISSHSVSHTFFLSYTLTLPTCTTTHFFAPHSPLSTPISSHAAAWTSRAPETPPQGKNTTGS